MSNQMNDMDKRNDEVQNEGAVSGILGFCGKNIRFIGGAAVLVILVVALILITGKKDPKEERQDPAGTEAVQVSSETEERYEELVDPEIEKLIQNYYKAYAKGKLKKVEKLASPISDAEKSYISVFSEYLMKCENITCFTKKGLEEGSYIVSVYLDMKFKDIETTAPGLEMFYVQKEDGQFHINNLYGQFNLKRQVFDTDEAIMAKLDEFSQQEDVLALREKVQKRYEKALGSDESLKELVETTIPDAFKVQAVEAKKAEEEKKAAKEEEKKKAEEAAAKKAEEEKKAAERASAVTVYALDKVNVRADASETADVLGQLEPGAQTTRLEERDDGWSRVDFTDGQEGYIKSEFLSTEKPDPAQAPAAEEEAPPASSAALPEGKTITVQESLNIRKSMSEDADKVATAFAGDTVTVIMSYQEGWTKVSYKDITVYIRTDLLQ